ncbi:MAG: hypothetical protein J6Y54_08075 [Lentisphaeria bacterium]|nr:hypothetical protein [Lentisphaeria bacterium]
MKKSFFFGLFGALCMLFMTGCGPLNEPPISVTWRTSLLNSNSNVMQVTNRSSRETLVLHLHVESRERSEKATYTFKVAPGDTEEIGILEMGWQFMPGEEYSIEADGYILSVDGTVPR